MTATFVNFFGISSLRYAPFVQTRANKAGTGSVHPARPRALIGALPARYPQAEPVECLDYLRPIIGDCGDDLRFF